MSVVNDAPCFTILSLLKLEQQQLLQVPCVFVSRCMFLGVILKDVNILFIIFILYLKTILTFVLSQMLISMHFKWNVISHIFFRAC